MNGRASLRLNTLSFPAGQDAQARPDLQLIYIHGLGGSCAAWYFHYLLPWRGRFGQVAYDMRGHGESDYPMTGYGVADHADDLLAVSTAEAGTATRRCYVGYSYGGCVALDYAVRHARADDRIVILDSPEVSRIDSGVIEELAGLKAAMRGETGAARGGLASEFTQVMGEGGGARRTVARYARRLERLLATRFPEEAVGNQPPAVQALAAIPCPMLLVYAGRGDCLPHAERLRAHVPDLRLVTLDAGHDLVSTHADDIRGLVIEFLQA